MKRLTALLLVITMLMTVLNIAVGEQELAPDASGIATPTDLTEAPAEEEPDVEDIPVEPTEAPTAEPTAEPTEAPTAEPTAEPTEAPTAEPTAEPTEAPTAEPTAEPTEAPTAEPTAEPTEAPTVEPTAEPTEGLFSEEVEEEIVEPTEEPVAEIAYRAGLVLSIDSESALLVYDATENGNIIGTLAKGQMIEIGTISAGWAMIRTDEIEGYVHSKRVALYNGEAAPEEEIRTITITTNVAGKTKLKEGSTIILYANLTGFDDDVYTVRWQYSPDGGATAIDIGGANDLTYAYRLTVENFNYMYRVVIDIEDAQSATEQ